MSDRVYEIVMIGVSAGGAEALMRLFSKLPGTLSIPIVIVQHLHPDQSDDYVNIFFPYSQLKVTEAREKVALEPRSIYIAPPNYHLLIERDKTLSLSIDKQVNFSRPSVDILFESGADAYGKAAIGIVLTGANSDGAAGLRYLAQRGGLTIVQSLDEAKFPDMPSAALEACDVDYVLTLDEIAGLITKLAR